MSDNVINRLTILMTSGESARLPSERGPGLIPRLGVICGLSLLLVLDLAPKGFFLRVLRFFLPPQKLANISKFQFESHRFVSRTRLLSVTLSKQSRLICFNMSKKYPLFKRLKKLQRLTKLQGKNALSSVLHVSWDMEGNLIPRFDVNKLIAKIYLFIF